MVSKLSGAVSGGNTRPRNPSTGEGGIEVNPDCVYPI